MILFTDLKYQRGFKKSISKKNVVYAMCLEFDTQPNAPTPNLPHDPNSSPEYRFFPSMEYAES